MTHDQFTAFSAFRERFRAQVAAWSSDAELMNTLASLQKEGAKADSVPDYPIETPIVYNTALDEITESDDIRIIVIGDNPGKSEQLATNRKYLVGQAGKIAESFFRRNPELGIDFRKNAIILNKTPLHTAKTKELAMFVEKTGGDNKAGSAFKATGTANDQSVAALLDETQRFMARETAALQKALNTPESPCAIWLVGYAELKPRGLFTTYRDILVDEYRTRPESNLYVYQHFSMNCFTTDLKKRADPALSLAENLRVIGCEHRKEIFGF